MSPEMLPESFGTFKKWAFGPSFMTNFVLGSYEKFQPAY